MNSNDFILCEINVYDIILYCKLDFLLKISNLNTLEMCIK